MHAIVKICNEELGHIIFKYFISVENTQSMPDARYVHAAIDSCFMRFSHLQQKPYIANIYNEH